MEAIWLGYKLEIYVQIKLWFVFQLSMVPVTKVLVVYWALPPESNVSCFAEAWQVQQPRRVLPKFCRN